MIETILSFALEVGDDQILQPGCIRVLIVLVPSYLMAWLTGKMVCVVPTVAAMVFLASGLSTLSTNRIDEDLEAEATLENHKAETGKIEQESPRA